MRGQKVASGGRRATHGEHAQGLGRGFYCVRIHRVFLWCSSSKAFSSSKLCAAAATEKLDSSTATATIDQKQEQMEQ